MAGEIKDREIEDPEMSTINQIQLPNGSIYGFEDIEARDEVTDITSAIGELEERVNSLKSDLANHSALHVLPLSDIADAQNGFDIQFCNVAIQGKIVLCWLSFAMNNITVPQWIDFAIAKLKSGYYPAETNPVGIVQEQASGLTGTLKITDNTIAMNTHNIVFNKEVGWCWGFIAYVLD